MLVLFMIFGKLSAEDKVFTSNGSIYDSEVWDTVSVQNDTTVVDMWGGTVADLGSTDASMVNIYGGDIIGGPGFLFEKGLSAWSSSTINIYGGYMCVASSFDSGKLNIYGGDIDVLWCKGTTPTGTATVDIFGLNLFLIETGGDYGYGLVSGSWSDNTQFIIDLWAANTAPSITLHEIPEPCTILLFSLGSIILVKKQKV